MKGKIVENLKLYLDNCCFNRPYDDQTQLKIELETKAKLFVQNLIVKKEVDLIWSYMLDYENSKNSFNQKRIAIQKWQDFAIIDIDASVEIVKKCKTFEASGLKNADALHLACAIHAGCDYFLSVDKQLLKYTGTEIVVCDPVEFLRIWEGK